MRLSLVLAGGFVAGMLVAYIAWGFFDVFGGAYMVVTDDIAGCTQPPSDCAVTGGIREGTLVRVYRHGDRVEVVATVRRLDPARQLPLRAATDREREARFRQ